MTSDWLLRPKNMTLFIFASIVMILTGLLMLALYLAGINVIFPAIPDNTVVKILGGILGVLAAPSGIYVLVGMLWYWAKLDRSTPLRKTLWFLIFVVTGFFGTAVYALTIYRSQVARRAQLAIG